MLWLGLDGIEKEKVSLTNAVDLWVWWIERHLWVWCPPPPPGPGPAWPGRHLSKVKRVAGEISGAPTRQLVLVLGGGNGSARARAFPCCLMSTPPFIATLAGRPVPTMQKPRPVRPEADGGRSRPQTGKLGHQGVTFGLFAQMLCGTHQAEQGSYCFWILMAAVAGRRQGKGGCSSCYNRRL